PSGEMVNGPVKITLSTLADPGMVLYTDNEGRFSFKELQAGNYSLEVTGDAEKFQAVTEQVRLQRGQRVNRMVYLKEKSARTTRRASHVVSAAEAEQKAPDAAKNEYDRATALANRGEAQMAIEGYKKAIAIFPNYLKAHNDLGVQYLKLKQFDEAAQEFEAAIEINSKAFNPLLNSGIALVEMKRYAEALDHLTRALSIDSAQPAAHLYFVIA